MRSCRKCLTTWCEKHTYKCPHCQSKSNITSDEELQKKMQEEQQQYPYVVKKVQEQCCVISLQQKQIAVMSKRLESIEMEKVKIQQERMLALLSSCLLCLLWLSSFWSVARAHSDCYSE